MMILTHAHVQIKPTVRVKVPCKHFSNFRSFWSKPLGISIKEIFFSKVSDYKVLRPTTVLKKELISR